MNPKSVKVSESELQRRHERFMMRWKTFTTLGKFLICATAAVLFAYYTFYMPIKESHGEATFISSTFNFLTDIKANVAIAWTVAAAGTLYGANERRLRHKERAERDDRTRRLEQRIDPNVTSSGLDASGTRSKAKPK